MIRFLRNLLLRFLSSQAERSKGSFGITITATLGGATGLDAEQLLESSPVREFIQRALPSKQARQVALDTQTEERQAESRLLAGEEEADHA